MKLDEFGLEAADLRMKLRVLIDAYPERLVARLLKGGSRYISLHGVAELLPQHLQETGAPEDARLALSRSLLVNECQSFAIRRQCDLNGMLWA
ncbi:MAG: hypothetical protein WBA14_04025 [Pseudolabrys sp.]